MVPSRNSTLPKAYLHCVCAGLSDHLGSHIDADHPPGCAYRSCRDEGIEARSRTQVEHDIARFQRSECHGVPQPSPRFAPSGAVPRSAPRCSRRSVRLSLRSPLGSLSHGSTVALLHRVTNVRGKSFASGHRSVSFSVSVWLLRCRPTTREVACGPSGKLRKASVAKTSASEGFGEFRSGVEIRLPPAADEQPRERDCGVS